MKNYYDRQRNSTLAQIDHLYKEKDTTFRGFRHSTGQLSGTGDKSSIKLKAIAIEGNEIMDGLVNWESSQAGDSERFSQETNNTNGNEKLTRFDAYLKKKEIRAATKKANKQKAINPNKKTPGKELSAN
jgi:hypothetical protein